MKKSNVIGVLSPDGREWLMCLRRKDPYKGLYNLVGGKVEPGETGEEGLPRAGRGDRNRQGADRADARHRFHVLPGRYPARILGGQAEGAGRAARGKEPAALVPARRGFLRREPLRRKRQHRTHATSASRGGHGVEIPGRGGAPAPPRAPPPAHRMAHGNESAQQAA